MNKKINKSQKFKKKKKDVNKESNLPQNENKIEATISKLLDHAKQSLYTYEFELALKFCEKALVIEPSNFETLDLQGSIYTEMGDFENAKKCLLKCLELDGKSSYARYMSLGQLSVGGEAVQFYRKGIQAIQDALSLNKSEDANCDTTSHMKDLSAAYLQLAEMYLTDECLNEEAEELCKTYLDQAIASYPSNIHTYHTYASYYISLNNKQMALEVMEKGLDMWLPRLREIHQSETMSIENGDMLDAGCRISCCKTLIELEEYDKASEILEYLLDENEALVEVWYLLGWLNYLKGNGYQGNVKFYMKKALDLANESEFDDEAMVDHIKEVLREMSQMKDDDDVVEENGDDEEEEDNGGIDDDEMDSSSDEKMEQ